MDATEQDAIKKYAIRRFLRDFFDSEWTRETIVRLRNWNDAYGKHGKMIMDKTKTQILLDGTK
jgi:hypothetical protein